MIEGQYRSATVRIVDTDAEHEVLEALLEESKPAVPEACRHLDYQFWSPFRYGRYPRASRFRRAGRTPGVWYGAEAVETAIAECVWGGLRFFRASPDTPLPRRPVEHTAVQARIAAPLALDLTAPGLAVLGRWDDPDDYSDCLALADNARRDGAEAIRYTSVRDPARRANVAVLTCAAFQAARPVAQQRWHILLRPRLVRAHCPESGARLSFGVGETALTEAS